MFKFIIGFLNQIRRAKSYTLAALFLKRSDDIVDQVLEKIKYNDYDLRRLTTWRVELAKSHEEFFKVIDRIGKSENQEEAVKNGVMNLFEIKEHDSSIPLINALESRMFNGRSLKKVAIRVAFEKGTINGITDIVKELHDRPAITHMRYAAGLSKSWNRANRIRFSHFYWLRLIKVIWRRLKKMRLVRAI